MDPISVVSAVEACAGLAVIAGKLAIGLNTLAKNYKLSEITLRSLSTRCRLFACTVRAIEQWMVDTDGAIRLETDIQDQLLQSLECASDAITALQTELVTTSGGTVNSLWEKINVIWNQPVLKELEDCICKQITGLSVLLQIMNLPNPHEQHQELVGNGSVFHASLSSAISVRDPKAPTLAKSGTCSPNGASTMLTGLSKLRSFDFDDVLLASQVYLRQQNRSLALKLAPTTHRKVQNTEMDMSGDDSPTFEAPQSFLPSEALAKSSREEIVEYLTNTAVPAHNDLIGKYQSLEKFYLDKENQLRKSKLEYANLEISSAQLKTTVKELSNQVASYQLALNLLNKFKVGYTKGTASHQQAIDSDDDSVQSSTYECRKCGRYFVDQHALQQHLGSSVHTPLYECEACDKQFADQRALDQHDSSVHYPLYECEECDREFGDQNALDQHFMYSAVHRFS